ncbi:MAG: type II toxin-antitoxin system RelE/ParE family toxin [Alphaproteobacteria bacterium]
MIVSFKCKETAKIWHGETSKKLPFDIQRRAIIKLAMINRAKRIEDLKIPPSNNLEALKGDRKEQHSIRINDKWRICFVWQDKDAHNVEIVDYH